MSYYVVDGYTVDGTGGGPAFYLFEYDPYEITSGKIVVPELQYWFDHFLQKSKMNKSRIPNPASLPDNLFWDTQTFIALLFDEKWAHTSFYYYFTENTLRCNWPESVLTRAMLYPEDARYFTGSATGTYNLFGINNGDIEMMQYLMAYRLQTPTDFILGRYAEDDYIVQFKADNVYDDPIETERYTTMKYEDAHYTVEPGQDAWTLGPYLAPEYLPDFYAQVGDWMCSNVNYDALTPLGKLIYIYLDVVLNESLEKYNPEVLIAPQNDLLASMYEAYVLENIYAYLSQKANY